MIELSDRNLLALMDAYKGQGLEIDGVQYVRQAGETPLVFINRVKEIHGAWRNRQKIKAAQQVRSNAEGNRTEYHRSSTTDVHAKQDIQESEASLEEILKSKISSLRYKVNKLEKEIESRQEELDNLVLRLSQKWTDLKVAERWLRELNASTPENNKKMGEDMVGEVSQGQRGGDSVGNEDNPS